MIGKEHFVLFPDRLDQRERKGRARNAVEARAIIPLIRTLLTGITSKAVWSVLLAFPQ